MFSLTKRRAAILLGVFFVGGGSGILCPGFFIMLFLDLGVVYNLVRT